MTTIRCSIPLKLRLRGELREADWKALEDRLALFYASAIERSLRELAKSRVIEKPFAGERSLASQAEQL